MQVEKIIATKAFLRKPHTAAELADHLSVSRPTAYAYIREAAAMRVGSTRQGSKGPAAATFQVT